MNSLKREYLNSLKNWIKKHELWYRLPCLNLSIFYSTLVSPIDLPFSPSVHVARQTSDPRSGFATVEKDFPGGLTPMLGDRKVSVYVFALIS